MSRAQKALVLAVIAGLALSPTAGAGWLHFANSVVQAEQEVQKHPQSLTQVVVVPGAVTKPYYCVAYHSTIGQGDTGRVVATATIRPFEGKTETLKFVGGVKDNSFLSCKKGPNLAESDVVLFEYDLKKMPRLRSDDQGADLAEVSGVISTNGKPELGQDVPLGLVPSDGLAPLGLIPADKGGWFHSVKSVLQADKASQKHPKRLVQTLILPTESKRPKVCVAYSNAAPEKNKGRVVTTVTIGHMDGTEERLKFAGGVRKNEYLKCKKAPNMGPGDIVDFSYQLKGMPRLGMGADGAEFADINGVVSTSGNPLFREPPPPPPPPPPAPKEEPVPVAAPPAPTSPTPPTAPPPPPPPAPPAGGGGGSVSSADQQAVFRLLKSSTKSTQLWRAKNNSPGKWIAVGPKTKVISGNNLDYSTAGVGGTISAAVSDYERKTNSNLGAGGNLSGTEASLIQWYSDINSAGGPTSVRRDIQSRYHGEYFRPGRGATTATFSTLVSALDWLKKQGL